MDTGTGEDMTQHLFGLARADAIGNVFKDYLTKYDKVLDLNQAGLDKLVPAYAKGGVGSFIGHSLGIMKDICYSLMDGSYVTDIDAITAYGGFDQEMFGIASRFLEGRGVFCYFQDAPAEELFRFYSNIGYPFQQYDSSFLFSTDTFNEWLDGMGFSVIEEGTRFAARSFMKWDAPMDMPAEHPFPMYDMGNQATIVSSIFFSVSQKK